MIIVDTNVLSELMKAQPASSVLGWFRQQKARDLFVASITEGEIWLGIELLRDGQRRRTLEEVAETVLTRDFAGRRLSFDSQAAEEYGKLAAELRKQGRMVGLADVQIASIALVHGFAVATRNTRHFADCGIALIDPFTPAGGR